MIFHPSPCCSKIINFEEILNVDELALAENLFIAPFLMKIICMSYLHHSRLNGTVLACQRACASKVQ